MACSSLLPASFRTLTALPSIAQYEWFTGWIACTGLSSFIAVLKHKNVTGNFRGQVAAQWAVVRTDDPSSSPSTFGSALSGGGEACIASGDISGTSASKFYVRFGVKYDVSSGSEPALADVSLQVSADICGQVVAAFTGELVATTSVRQYRAIGPWIPALSAGKLKFAGVVNGLIGDFQWRATYRTATTSTEAPNAWTSDWDSTNNPDKTAGEVNTGELAPSLSGVMWVQPGIQCNLSDTDVGQASFVMTVAARKS